MEAVITSITSLGMSQADTFLTMFKSPIVLIAGVILLSIALGVFINLLKSA